jgi:hypothetical protein
MTHGAHAALSRPDRNRFPIDTPPGRRAALFSLLMIPAAFAMYLPAFLVGTALQSALGLAEDEKLREAGAAGVAGGVFLIVIMLAAPVAGVVLGVRARRLGERRLGALGLAGNVAIAAFVLFVNLVGLLG